MSNDDIVINIHINFIIGHSFERYKLIFKLPRGGNLNLIIKKYIDVYISTFERINNYVVSSAEYNTYCGLIYARMIKHLSLYTTHIPSFYDIWEEHKVIDKTMAIDETCKKILQSNWNSFTK